MNRFEYVSPKSVEEAVKLLAPGSGALAKSGGTDLVARMKDRLAFPKTVVNLLGLALDRIEAGEKSIKVGALVTLAELAAHEKARKGWAALAQAAGEAATPQIRNVATVGGNLCQRPRCWYFRSPDFTCLKKGGEGCPAIEGDNRYHAAFGEAKCPCVHASNLGPALVAMDGVVHVVGSGGARAVPAPDFFATEDVKRENSLKDDEVVVAIEVPAGWKSAYLEVRERQSFDWPLASVVVAQKGEDARVVLGAVSPAPWRSTVAERAWSGGGAKVAEAAVAMAKPMSGNAYKVEIVKALIPRAMEMMK